MELRQYRAKCDSSIEQGPRNQQYPLIHIVPVGPLADVSGGGLLADPQYPADLPIAFALADPPRDIALTFGKRYRRHFPPRSAQGPHTPRGVKGRGADRLRRQRRGGRYRPPDRVNEGNRTTGFSWKVRRHGKAIPQALGACRLEHAPVLLVHRDHVGQSSPVEASIGDVASPMDRVTMAQIVLSVMLGPRLRVIVQQYGIA